MLSGSELLTSSELLSIVCWLTVSATSGALLASFFLRISGTVKDSSASDLASRFGAATTELCTSGIDSSISTLSSLGTPLFTVADSAGTKEATAGSNCLACGACSIMSGIAIGSAAITCAVVRLAAMGAAVSASSTLTGGSTSVW